MKQSFFIKQYAQRFGLTISIFLTSLSMTSCVPPLASKGQTHSQYAPVQPGQLNQSHHSGGVPTSPLPTSPSPVQAQSPASSASPAPTRPDAAQSLVLSEDEKLSISFNEALLIPSDVKNAQDFDQHNCRELVLQGGQWLAQSDLTHFSCAVHYCVFSPGLDPTTKFQLRIAQGTHYSFKTSDHYSDSQGFDHVVLQWESGGMDAGKIDQILCDGYGGSLLVGDLIDALGSTAQGDVADIRVQESESLPSPVPVAVPGPSLGPTAKKGLGRTPSSVEESDASETQSESRATTQIDAINSARPNFGLHLIGSPIAFGGAQISPAQQGASSSAFQLMLEYQPWFLQKLGVFSLGLSGGIYPMGSNSAGASVATGIGPNEVGAQARYQFRYLDGQWIVPYVSYEVQSLGYNLNNGGGSGRVMLAGGSGGVGLLLNKFVPNEARDCYQNTGISRSYFVVEAKYLDGSDQNISVSGTSAYFGFRFER